MWNMKYFDSRYIPRKYHNKNVMELLKSKRKSRRKLAKLSRRRNGK